jgi:sugar lactone lactonase YvrE
VSTPSIHTANALALSPDGSALFVTGQVAESEYGTVGYDLTRNGA